MDYGRMNGSLSALYTNGLFYSWHKEPPNNKCVSAAQHTQCQDSNEHSTAITPMWQPQSITCAVREKDPCCGYSAVDTCIVVLS